MPLNTLFQSAGRIFKSGLGISSPSAPMISRADKARTRLENMRKASVSAKDAAVHGTSQATSARNMLKQQLGRDPNVRTGGTSVRRIDVTPGNMPGIGHSGAPFTNTRPPSPPKR